VNAQSCSSERKAWDVIHGAAGDVMRGSDSVRRTGNSSYLARWTTIDSISGWAL